MSNGDWIVGLFNRDDNTTTVEVNFADLGIDGARNVRDLWKHTDEGQATSIKANIAPHGCKS